MRDALRLIFVLIRVAFAWFSVICCCAVLMCLCWFWCSCFIFVYVAFVGVVVHFVCCVLLGL